MSRPRILVAIGALILAVLGTIGMVAYVSGAEERAASGETLAEVWVVKDRVPGGTPAERIPSLVRQELVPQKLINGDTVGDLADLAGLVTEVPLLPGEILSIERFVDPQTFEREADRVIDRPAGLQEVTVALEPARAAGGLIVPGDTVGVLMSFEPFDIESEGTVLVDGQLFPGGSSTNTTTHQPIHKVLVTNVQLEEVPEIADRKGLDDEQDRPIRLVPSGNLLVTMAVDVATAERIVFAAEFGSIWLTNQAGDAVEAPSIIQNRGTVHEDIEDLGDLVVDDDGGDL